jgi:signal transduction histidine kinase
MTSDAFALLQRAPARRDVARSMPATRSLTHLWPTTGLSTLARAWLACALLLVIAFGAWRLMTLEAPAVGSRSSPVAREAHHAQRQRIVVESASLIAAVLLAAGIGIAGQRRRSSVDRAPTQPDEPPMRNTAPGDGAQQIAGLLVAAGPRLRQPLQALSLYAGSLHQDTAAPVQRQALRGMQASVSELAGVIDEVDQLLQWLQRDQPLAPATLPVAALFATLQRELAPLALERDVALHWHSASCALASDADLAKRLLRALVGNALRSARGRVLVAARPGQARVRVQVRDDGPRFAPAVPVSLAELLQDSQDANRRAAGLGVAAGVAGLLGLELTVRSPPGGGNVMEAAFAWASLPAAPHVPDNAALLSLALLQSEARHGQRVRASQPGAPVGEIAKAPAQMPPPRDGHAR